MNPRARLGVFCKTLFVSLDRACLGFKCVYIHCCGAVGTWSFVARRGMEIEVFGFLISYIELSEKYIIYVNKVDRRDKVSSMMKNQKTHSRKTLFFMI